MNLEQFNIPRYLATLPLFSHLDEGELERLSKGCALRRLERGKLVFRTHTGYETQSAYLNIINQCLKQMQSLMAEFGMTPATRERLKAIANAPKQQNLFDDFLTRKRDVAQNG